MKKIGLILMLLVISSQLVSLPDRAWAAIADPYQDVQDEKDIKTYFLRRIANASEPGDPPFVIPGYAPPAQMIPGQLFLVQNSSELDETFKNVAKKIKLRLVG